MDKVRIELETIALDVEGRVADVIEERNRLRSRWNDAEAVRARAAELTRRPEVVA